MDHFISLGQLPLKEAIKGGFLGILQTANLTIAYTNLKAGVTIPLHQHPEEAIDIVLEGELEMQVGDATSILNNGMISVVPSNIPHTARALSDCKVITVFYPRRGL
jgi:quercetin dioxygenase-like cupin family protein